ncbi:uncharacterized membrane protein YjgN (DUF898 family) [Phyllobacterium brassicacearum]|nr:DUF898 family protein [Phyllobacterium brassicacearum]TDQ27314.1 uncharacterized membrane protein YjgN (DUF898 family) [Phyllobacterium brassicacearum]
MRILEQNYFGRRGSYRAHRFVFSGTTKEYFGIWIVNVLLTIVTFGIYSAWAKVRRNRYLYGNTALADGRFDYHARPIQILIGQIIVIGFLILYNVLLSFAPAVGLVLAVVFAIGIPWLIARGLRFNARVTSYRNVRFDFAGRYWGAAKAFFLGPVIAAITLGICAPIASRWMLQYTLGNLSYGGRKFSVDPSLSDIFRVWWLCVFLAIGGAFILGIFAAVIAMFFGVFASGSEEHLQMVTSIATIVTVGVYLVLFLVYASVGLIYGAGVRNIGLSATTFDDRHPRQTCRGWITLGLSFPI